MFSVRRYITWRSELFTILYLLQIFSGQGGDTEPLILTLNFSFTVSFEKKLSTSGYIYQLFSLIQKLYFKYMFSIFKNNSCKNIFTYYGIFRECRDRSALRKLLDMIFFILFSFSLFPKSLELILLIFLFIVVCYCIK